MGYLRKKVEAQESAIAPPCVVWASAARVGDPKSEAQLQVGSTLRGITDQQLALHRFHQHFDGGQTNAAAASSDRCAAADKPLKHLAAFLLWDAGTLIPDMQMTLSSEAETARRTAPAE